MRRFILPIALLAGASPAAAQSDLGDIAAGRRLAETWCANCHRVSPTGPGPATDAAPALAAVAALPTTTPLALRVFKHRIGICRTSSSAGSRPII